MEGWHNLVTAFVSCFCGILFAPMLCNRWLNSELDVYCAIPYLCEYVGHRDISSTKVYLRLLPERFSGITKQMQEYCICLIPEVLN